ncbi:MAG: hypothetical protein RL172_1773 [Bacteroidota bacterium]|jgi:hypothetical protein
MKKLVLLFILITAFYTGKSQGLTAENLLAYLSADPVKFDNQLAKKKFFYSGLKNAGDTLLKIFNYKPELKRKDELPDSVVRKLYRSQVNKEAFTITYLTNSAEEAGQIGATLKNEGFYCNESGPLFAGQPLLYQYKDVTATFKKLQEDTLAFYTIELYRKKFPRPEDIYYADDLLVFNSHEYLAYFFGAQNVAKDVFYFSGNEISNCSVLFPNSNRQAVFIWEDEVNKTNIRSILFGGQQKLKSQVGYESVIAENNWLLKSGVHAGMPLYELLVRNKADFVFYAGNSINEGSIKTEKNGEIDFKRENILLGCVNCTDEKYAASTEMSAQDAVEDSRILFVLSVALNPGIRSGK